MFSNSFLTGCVLVLVVSTTASLAPAQKHRGKCTPFEARGTATSIEVKGGPPPAPLTFKLKAQGTATHLGKYTSDAGFVVRFTSPTKAVFEGGGTLTGANGDKIYFVMAGDFLPGPVPGGLGRFKITGGTGRLSGARGGGVFASMGGATTFDGSICIRRRGCRRGR